TSSIRMPIVASDANDLLVGRLVAVNEEIVPSGEKRGGDLYFGILPAGETVAQMFDVVVALSQRSFRFFSNHFKPLELRQAVTVVRKTLFAMEVVKPFPLRVQIYFMEPPEISGPGRVSDRATAQFDAGESLREVKHFLRPNMPEVVLTSNVLVERV